MYQKPVKTCKKSTT